LIEHVRSIETFATVIFDGGFLFVFIYLFFEFVFYSWINSEVIFIGSNETNSIISYIVLSRNLKWIRYFIIIFFNFTFIIIFFNFTFVRLIFPFWSVVIYTYGVTAIHNIFINCFFIDISGV